MSDRLIIAVASLPLVSGVLLLGILQRPAAASSESRTSAHAAGAMHAPQELTREPWIGVVSASSNADLAAEFHGRVTHVWAKAGQLVRKGEPILEIDRADVTTTLGVAGAELGQRRSDAQRAEARLDAARSRLARLEVAGSWLSAQELDAARTEVRVAQAELSAARSSVAMGRARVAQQKLRADRHKIVAPFEGTVVSIDADLGDSVAEGQLLARLISDRRVIRFAMPRDELVPGFEEVEVRQGPGRPGLRALVDAVRPEVDLAAQLVFASAALPEEARDLPEWLPGTAVQVLPLRASGKRPVEAR